MEFRLPENLHHQLLAYDPALKALAKQQQAANKPALTKKKAKYPIGNINDLIPTNIVSAADMQSAVDYINAQTAPYKHRVFYAPHNPDQKAVVKAIIYYWESVWIAAWLPAEGEDYLYGISYAVSTTKAAKKDLRHIRFNRAEMDINLADVPLKKYGRVDYHVYTKVITADTVCHANNYHWDPFCVFTWSEKGKHIKRECINVFTEQLSERISLKWEGDGLFSRMDKKASCLDYIFGETLSAFPHKVYARADVNWVPTASNIGPILLKQAGIPSNIFMKPFIQKELQAACTKTVEIFNDPTTSSKYGALKPIKRFISYMQGIKWIWKLWPNTPIDYYLTYKNALSSIEFDSYRMEYLVYDHTYHQAKEWIQKHMPMPSMFLILNKAVEEKQATQEVPVNNLSIFNLIDIFQMIFTVLKAGQPLEPPSRWRLTEFHDHVQSVAWKVQNKNENLPQDLFPAPIKIEHNNQVWTFFQPIDTHQLSAWGQAVRNCVGTGGYAEDVKKRLQFIVLCMLDGKPKFTIQLKLNQGLMSVQQIAGIGNARLNDDEKALYTDTFRQALAIRSAVE
jgi:hypothetical protein